MKLQLTLVTALLLGLSTPYLPAKADKTMSGSIQFAQTGRKPQTTYMTPQSANAIAVDIRDGSFYFATILRRTSGSIYSATQNGVRVIYDRSSRRVTVINNRNGEELYNYFFTEASRPPAVNLPSQSPPARGISTLRANNPNTRINVRSQPTINSRSPHYGLPGDRVRVLQCVQDQDNPGSSLNWCRVQFVQSRATGWVRSDFIIFADGGE